MAQFHYVIFFDDKKNKWKIDNGTAEAHFPDGTIWNGEDWETVSESPLADVEDEIYRELQEIIDFINTGE